MVVHHFNTSNEALFIVGTSPSLITGLSRTSWVKSMGADLRL